MSFDRTIADIPTQLNLEGQAVDTTGAELISIVGAAAGGALKSVQKSRVESDIQETASVVSAVSAAVEQGGDSVFNKEGTINTDGLPSELQAKITAVQASAGEKFSRIANAVKQGALPSAAAALETESTMRQLISQTPGFGSEIRAMARDLIGFDPTGFALRQILNPGSEAKKPPTAQEKRVEEAKVLQDGLARAGQSISLDTIMGNIAVRENLQLERDIADSELEMGTVNMRQWAQQSFADKGPDLGATMLKIAEMGKDGGITEPAQFSNAVISQREADKVAFRAQVATNGGMDPREMAVIEGQIDSMYNPLIKSIEDNQMGELLDTKLELVGKVNKLWGKQATPRLTRTIDAYGPQIGGQLLEMMTNIADPAQFELVYQSFPKLKEVIMGGSVTQKGVAEGVDRVTQKVLAGQPINPEDMDFRNITEVMITQPGNSSLRESYVRGLGASGSPVRAVSILTDSVPRQQATPAEVDFVKAQYNLHIGVQGTEDIPGNLIDAVAREIMELDPSSRGGDIQASAVEEKGFLDTILFRDATPTGQTKFTIPYDPSKQGALLNWQTPSMKKIQPFLDAATKSGYASDLGVDQATVVGELMNRVNSRIDTLMVRNDPSLAGSSPDFIKATTQPSSVTEWEFPESRPVVSKKETVTTPEGTQEERVTQAPVIIEDIDPTDYIEAVRMAESNGNQNAVSPVGARGSMQVMDPTAANPGFGVAPARRQADGTISLDERDRVGEDYLKAMLKRYNGDFEAALIAYNAGPGNADKWVKANKDYAVLPKRSETEPYVKRAYRFLKKRLEAGNE